MGGIDEFQIAEKLSVVGGRRSIVERRRRISSGRSGPAGASARAMAALDARRMQMRVRMSMDDSSAMVRYLRSFILPTQPLRRVSAFGACNFTWHGRPAARESRAYPRRLINTQSKLKATLTSLQSGRYAPSCADPEYRPTRRSTVAHGRAARATSVRSAESVTHVSHAGESVCYQSGGGLLH